MATAKEKNGKYVLELEPEEAEFLYSLLFWNIAGPPNGPRGHSDQIIYALLALGLESFPKQRVRKLSTDMPDLCITGWMPKQEISR